MADKKKKDRVVNYDRAGNITAYEDGRGTLVPGYGLTIGNKLSDPSPEEIARGRSHMRKGPNPTPMQRKMDSNSPQEDDYKKGGKVRGVGKATKGYGSGRIV